MAGYKCEYIWNVYEAKGLGALEYIIYLLMSYLYITNYIINSMLKIYLSSAVSLEKLINKLFVGCENCVRKIQVDTGVGTQHPPPPATIANAH